MHIIKTAVLIFLLTAEIFTISSNTTYAMCYYNRDSDCEFIVRWRPSAIFKGDSLWKVSKGKRICSADNSGKINLNRGVTGVTEVGLSIIFQPGPSGTPKIFPKCTSNAEIEDHGWASLFLTSDFKSGQGCGCGLAGTDFTDSCESDNTALEQANNDGFECLIFNDDGHKIYP